MSDMVGLCCCGGDGGGGGGGGGGEETIGDWRFVYACREWGAQQFKRTTFSRLSGLRTAGIIKSLARLRKITVITPLEGCSGLVGDFVIEIHSCVWALVVVAPKRCLKMWTWPWKAETSAVRAS
jgi:hypothetical protein